MTCLEVVEHVPDPARGAVAGSELAVLLREVQKKRRHLPVRQLFQQIPGLVPRLKPCVLMSPLSIAQYLPITEAIFAPGLSARKDSSALI